MKQFATTQSSVMPISFPRPWHRPLVDHLQVHTDQKLDEWGSVFHSYTSVLL